ncbi:hypothetical protein ALI22I_20025 [Saccharothrix sp. ALI-22-I]|nr:hypothetical protein ALI22I_20025 [Saccharothrix sp. ALI-22-I]
MGAITGGVGAVTGMAALGVAVWAARSGSRSADAAADSAGAARASADSAATTARIEGDRHHLELIPALRFRLTVDTTEAGSTAARLGATARLTITLDGPQDLDGVAVAIRDDRPDRAPHTAGRPTAEDIAATLWGPWRFRPGVDHATRDGRAVPARPLARRDTLVFALDPAPVPDWTTADLWTRTHADAPLRLTITCTRAGHQPWELREDVYPEPADP